MPSSSGMPASLSVARLKSLYCSTSWTSSGSPVLTASCRTERRRAQIVQSTTQNSFWHQCLLFRLFWENIPPFIGVSAPCTPVQHWALQCVGSAEYLSSTLAASRWPRQTANSSGVRPRGSRRSTSSCGAQADSQRIARCGNMAHNSQTKMY